MSTGIAAAQPGASKQKSTEKFVFFSIWLPIERTGELYGCDQI